MEIRKNFSTQKSRYGFNSGSWLINRTISMVTEAESRIASKEVILNENTAHELADISLYVIQLAHATQINLTQAITGKYPLINKNTR